MLGKPGVDRVRYGTSSRTTMRGLLVARAAKKRRAASQPLKAPPARSASRSPRSRRTASASRASSTVSACWVAPKKTARLPPTKWERRKVFPTRRRPQSTTRWACPRRANVQAPARRLSSSVRSSRCREGTSRAYYKPFVVQSHWRQDLERLEREREREREDRSCAPDAPGGLTCTR